VQVFWDVDGVICDFVRGSFALHGVSIPYDDVQWDFDKQLGLTPEEFWKPLGYDFWRNLPVLEHGRRLLTETIVVVGINNVGLLTSPCQTSGCVEGKLDWIKDHFPYMDRKVLIGAPKYLCAGPNKLLVDDNEGNIEAWRNAGGVGILYPQPWNKMKGAKIDLDRYRRYLCRVPLDGNLATQDFYV
jgi:5'(3')-deoxyribonucleotidase